MTGAVDEVLAHYRSLVRRWDEPLRASGCALWVRGRDHYRVGEVVHLSRATPSRTRLPGLLHHNSTHPDDPLAGLVPTLGGAVVLEPVGTDVAALVDRLSLSGVAISVRWTGTGVRVTSAVDGETTEGYDLSDTVPGSDARPEEAGELSAAIAAAMAAAGRHGGGTADPDQRLPDQHLAVGLTTAEALTGIRLPQPGPFTLLRAVRLRAPR